MNSKMLIYLPKKGRKIYLSGRVNFGDNNNFQRKKVFTPRK